jgi:hypothetical protein
VEKKRIKLIEFKQITGRLFNLLVIDFPKINQN